MFDMLGGLLGIGLDIFGTWSEADQRADLARDNAARYQKEAEYQEYRTSVRLSELETYKDQLIANQRVTMAKAGIIIDRNTAMKVVESSARQYDRDVEALLIEGKFNVERARMGAASMLESASQIKTASWLDIGRTLLNYQWEK